MIRDGSRAARVVMLAALGFLANAGAGAISKVQDLGTASQFLLGGMSLSITVPAGGVAAGDSIILTFVMDVAAGAVSISDSAGNTYLKDADVAGLVGAVRRTIIFSSHGVLPLAGGNTITATFPALATAKALSASEFSGLASSGTLDRTNTNSNMVPDTAPTSGFTMPTSQASELLIGAIGVLQPLASGFTPGSGYTVLPRAGTSAGSGNVTIDPEFQIVSSTGSYQADGTLAAAALWSAAIATYRAAAPTPTNTPTVTSTPTFTVTNTPTQTFTVTLTPTQTFTVTLTPTQTFTVTNTPTQTSTVTLTPTPTFTVTNSPTQTFTVTLTSTPTFTVTNTPTQTSTVTLTPTPTFTITNTPTQTFTVTLTPTPTFTVTNSPTQTSTRTPPPTSTPAPATPTRTVTLSISPTPTPGVSPPSAIPTLSRLMVALLAIGLALAAILAIRKG